MTIFDIETGPVSDSELTMMLPEFIPPVHPGKFIESAVKLGNLKDPDKRREKIEQARADHADSILCHEQAVASAKLKHFTDFKRDAALSPLTGQVIAIGIMDGQSRIIHGNEAETLVAFWAAWNKSEDDWAGWNVFNFDLPFLIKRSWRHGIKVPERLRNGRYWSTSLIDLMESFAAGKWGDKCSLDNAAKFLGCGNKTGSGADFAALWENDRAAAMAYLTNDLEITHGIAVRMGLIEKSTQPPPPF